VDDPKLTELRGLVGQHEKLVCEAVKAGKVTDLPHESQLYAQAIQEHMHLKHVHNALEIADLREGAPYEIRVGGDTVSPLAHLATHAAVKGQIEQDPLARAAFEKIVATGTSAHHAEYVLIAVLLELLWEGDQTVKAGSDTAKAQSIYNHKLEELNRNSAFRRKLTRRFSADHFVFE
jgi:hypothetical protein